LIDQINNVSKESWFFGFLTAEESMTLLQKNNLSKSFLVRFSTKQWGHYVLAFNVPNPRSKSKITQVRIYSNSNKLFRIEDHHFKDLTFLRLSDCVAHMKEKGIISESCNGSPFIKLSCEKPETQPYYMGGFLQKSETVSSLHQTI